MQALSSGTLRDQTPSCTKHQDPPPPALLMLSLLVDSFHGVASPFGVMNRAWRGQLINNRCSTRKTKVLEDKDFEICAICDGDSQIPLPKVLIARKASSLRIFC